MNVGVTFTFFFFAPLHISLFTFYFFKSFLETIDWNAAFSIPFPFLKVMLRFLLFENLSKILHVGNQDSKLSTNEFVLA